MRHVPDTSPTRPRHVPDAVPDTSPTRPVQAPSPSEGDAAPAADSSGPLAGIALTIAGTSCPSLQYVIRNSQWIHG